MQINQLSIEYSFKHELHFNDWNVRKKKRKAGTVFPQGSWWIIIEWCLQEKEISCTRNTVKVILGKVEFLAANIENEYLLACPQGPHETWAGGGGDSRYLLSSPQCRWRWNVTSCNFNYNLHISEEEDVWKSSKATSQDTGFYSPVPTSSLTCSSMSEGQHHTSEYVKGLFHHLWLCFS